MQVYNQLQRLLVYLTPSLYKKIRPTQELQFNSFSPQQLNKVHMIINNKISNRQKNI